MRFRTCSRKSVVFGKVPDDRLTRVRFGESKDYSVTLATAAGRHSPDRLAGWTWIAEQTEAERLRRVIRRV